MAKWMQGVYTVKNKEKYAGNKAPRYRSSWEMMFCQFCDNNPSVLQWASESIQIPYFNPIKNRPTIYVPDFFIVYVDKNGQNHAELIEIKPQKETTMEHAGKSQHNRLMVAINHAKWAAAAAFCQKQGIKFRIVTEQDIFFQGGKKR